MDLRIVFLSKSEGNRQWEVDEGKFEFDYRILGGWHWFFDRWEVPLHLNLGIIRQLLQFKPTVVISMGYDAPVYWQAAMYCKLRRISHLIWSGSTLASARQSTGVIGWLKRTIIGMSNGYVAYGSEAKEYLEYLGADPNRVHIAINTVDMNWFRDQSENIRNQRDFRYSRSMYPKFLLLYSGRLTSRKGIKLALETLHHCNDKDIGLMIVGSGPEEKDLKEFVEHKNIQNVFFEGFQQVSELPRYYAFADAVVLPTDYDRWGLVVNEALATGAYVLCSNLAGASRDLIQSGWNGDTFDPLDARRFRDLVLETKSNLQTIRDRRRDISRHACEEYGIEASAIGIIKAVQMAHQL